MTPWPRRRTPPCESPCGRRPRWPSDGSSDSNSSRAWVVIWRSRSPPSRARSTSCERRWRVVNPRTRSRAPSTRCWGRPASAPITRPRWLVLSGSGGWSRQGSPWLVARPTVDGGGSTRVGVLGEVFEDDLVEALVVRQLPPKWAVRATRTFRARCRDQPRRRRGGRGGYRLGRRRHRGRLLHRGGPCPSGGTFPMTATG